MPRSVNIRWTVDSPGRQGNEPSLRMKFYNCYSFNAWLDAPSSCDRHVCVISVFNASA